MMTEDFSDIDKQVTIKNRSRLFSRDNLLFWYNELYKRVESIISGFSDKQILEVGSGMSPLQLFYPNVITSDVMELDYVDYVFDAHCIDEFEAIQPNSLDVITCTNVLHHLCDPVLFLINASKKLKENGRIILIEPYFSVLSKLIYQKLHHEPSDFSITKPMLSNIKGPLSSANMAIPFMLFFGNEDWDFPLREIYLYSTKRPTVFSGLSYMITGGVSKALPIPFWIYKMVFKVDLWLSDQFPNYFGAFFIMDLRKRARID